MKMTLKMKMKMSPHRLLLQPMQPQQINVPLQVVLLHHLVIHTTTTAITIQMPTTTRVGTSLLAAWAKRVTKMDIIVMGKVEASIVCAAIVKSLDMVGHQLHQCLRTIQK